MVPMNKSSNEAMGATNIHYLPDELLRPILLRLNSPLWLIRAASACKRWRRAVTDGSDEEARTFLRLARSLHPPTVVGHYHNFSGGGYRFVPSSSPPVDGSRRVAADDFQDTYSSAADCHGGLVLLRMRYGPETLSVPNLLVYDPLLTRKYRWVTSRPRLPNENVYSCYTAKDTFLLDGDDGSISISNFRVLYWLNTAVTATDPQACLFSTANGGEWKWLFSVDVNRMEMRVLPGETRNIFKYTLPWPRFLRACS